MYPDERTLMEVGRVAIAAGRLDAELGRLWWHLAPDLVTELDARKASAWKARDGITTLAKERLAAEHRDKVLAVVDDVKAAQDQRNAVLHANWLLRGDDALRPVAEFLALHPTEREAYLTEWDRAATASDGWLRQPNDALELTDPHHLDELVALERRLSDVTTAVVRCHFVIASMRESGIPPGWQGPPEVRRGPQPLPPGAITGDAAIEVLRKLSRRRADEPQDS